MKPPRTRFMATGILLTSGLLSPASWAMKNVKTPAPALLPTLMIPIASPADQKFEMNNLAPRLSLEHTDALLDINHFAVTQIPGEGFWLRRGDQVAAIPQPLQKGAKVAFANINDGSKVNELVLTKKLAHTLQNHLQAENVGLALRTLARQFDGSRSGSRNSPLPAAATAEELDYIRDGFHDLVTWRIVDMAKAANIDPAWLKPTEFVALMRKAIQREAAKANAPSPMALQAAVASQKELTRILAVAAGVIDTKDIDALEKHMEFANFIWGIRLQKLAAALNSPLAIVSELRAAADRAEQTAKDANKLKMLARVVAYRDQAETLGSTLGALSRLTEALNFYSQLQVSEFPVDFIAPLKELSDQVPHIPYRVAGRATDKKDHERALPAIEAARRLREKLEHM